MTPRIVKVLKDDEFVKCEMSELRDGDIFTLQESEGNFVGTSWKAYSGPYINEIGTYEIIAEPHRH